MKNLTLAGLLTTGVGVTALITTRYVSMDIQLVMLACAIVIAIHHLGWAKLHFFSFILAPVLFFLGLFHAYQSETSLITASIGLLLALINYKAFHLSAPKDHWHFFVFGMLALLLASILTTSMAYFFYLFSFVALTIWLFILLTLSKYLSNVPVKLTGIIALCLVILIPASFLLFFMLPRMSHRVVSLETLEGRSSTGFTDSVELGDVGEIKVSEEAVFRAHIKGIPPAMLEKVGLYWRGIALDHYEDGRWQLTDDRSILLGKRQRSYDLGPRGLYKTIEQEIILEPMGSYYLIGLDSFVGLDFKEPVTVALGSTQSLLLTEKPTSKISYVARSWFSYYTLDQLKSGAGAELPPKIIVPNTQLPEDFSPRIMALAKEITKGALTDYERVLAVQDTLLKNYQYSLERPATAVTDPLDDFLFESRSGHCELFASAMALMLRSLQIPARLVNGFNGGEYNEVGDFYLVREINAHSWVEVFFRQVGWIRFDPSPVFAPAVPEVGIKVMLVKYWEAIKYNWYRWIVHFSYADQMVFLADAKQFSDELQYKLVPSKNFQWKKPNFFTVKNGALLVLAILLVAYLSRKQAQRQKTRRQLHPHRRQLQRTWQKVMKQLAKQGYVQDPAETLQKFLQRNNLDERMGHLVEDYERLRFGKNLPAKHELRQFRQRVASCKESLLSRF